MAARMTIDPGELRIRRMKAMLTPQDLAEMTGLSVTRIYQLEGDNGGGVRVDTVRKLAHVLSCRPAELAKVDA